MSYRLIGQQKMEYKKFDGLTFFEQWEKLESEIVREAPPTIHELF
ncbi:MAG: hypothetical protein Q8L79_17315 [Methylobacter sp.]|nr:hypothetical protein [Methylobacter sp.]MDP1666871.1 hypothetical protein [Methylobacter sp.]